MIVPNSEVQVQEVTPSTSEQVRQTRPSRIPVLQERYQTSSDVQQKPQVVKPKIKVHGKLQLTGQYLKIAIPSSEKVLDERWDKYYEMKDAKREAEELSERRGHETLLRDMAKVTTIIQRSLRRNLKPTIKQ